MSDITVATEKPTSNTEAAKQKPVSNPRTGNSKRGIDILREPSINKSTGFTEAERQALGLVGLVPDVTESIETQLTRVLLQLKHKTTDLDRFIYLMNLLLLSVMLILASGQITFESFGADLLTNLGNFVTWVVELVAQLRVTIGV